MEISPSSPVIPAPIAQEFADFEKILAPFGTLASRAQIDICDGVFVGTTSWPYKNEAGWNELEELAAGKRVLPYREHILYEAHLMVKDSARVGALLAAAGVSSIIAHVETFSDAASFLQTADMWRASGASSIGVALLLETPLSILESFVDSVDVVQLMGIETLGSHGEPFDIRTIERVKELHAMYPNVVIEVDGGVTKENIEVLQESGARRFVVGSALFDAVNPQEAFTLLQKTVDNAS